MNNRRTSPMDVLDHAERDAFGHIADPEATLSKIRKAAMRNIHASKSNAAVDELDRLAKARSEEQGIDFYDAYEQVCDEHPALLKTAILTG